jgi:polyhydroxybutyrate depolymerase
LVIHLEPGRSTVTLTSGGLERSAIVVVPPGWIDGSPRPLVLDLHGSGSTAREELARSRTADLAQTHDVVVVAPLGALRAGVGRAWNVPHLATAAAAPDDERFLLELVAALVVTGAVDRERVFATGMSGGGRMVSQLACDHPEVVAAIAPVAGLRAGPPDRSSPSRPAAGGGAPRGPVAVVAFHGTADVVNPYGGGGEPYWGYPVPAALARWAQVDGCLPEPVESRVTERVRMLAYRRLESGPVEVVLYVVDGGGHTWPGSSAPWRPSEGVVSTEIDATRIMADFFSAAAASSRR